MSDNDMNARIRRGRSLVPPVEGDPEPEPEPEPERGVDYGAGARAPASRSDPDAMRRWIAGQAHRSKLASVTVVIPTGAITKGKP